MEYVQYFEIVGTFNNKPQKLSIDIIPNLESISINTSTNQKLFELLFSEDNIKFQWGDYKQRLDQANSVSLWIKKEEFKILGKPEHIQWLFNLCKGKFLYISKDQKQKRTFVKQSDTGIVYKLEDQCNSDEQCFEKILFQKQQQFKQDYHIPEEIKLLKLINQNKCPYLMRLETIQYNGNEFSYSYKIKRLDSLNQLIKESQNLKLSQVLEIIRQLLQVTHYFESIKLVHNQLDLENIQYSKIENIIQITNFSSSFLEQSQPNILSKGQVCGHASPESYSSQQSLTTSTNIYQVGILFYIMVFGRNPFGNSQEEIQRNNSEGKFSIPKLSGLILEKYTKINEQMFEMISSMLSIYPTKRQSSKYYLSSKIFTPFFKQKISRMELSLEFNQVKQDDSINDEDQHLKPVYIFKTKF
ncbi:unnamed protein product [Paramecium primaurelia]|uniref:Protein kinase domain-containing protein n=1 Tax=Paramecium primaurelia TaxID=5886 RepID=A0A8S1KWT2_PARPR|nr:unnamed protein product [Paramecium primaurelia]